MDSRGSRPSIVAVVSRQGLAVVVESRQEVAVVAVVTDVAVVSGVSGSSCSKCLHLVLIGSQCSRSSSSGST